MTNPMVVAIDVVPPVLHAEGDTAEGDPDITVGLMPVRGDDVQVLCLASHS